MISFSRKDAKVLIKIEHGIFWGDGYFEFEINQSYEYQAELLKKALRDNLERHIKNIKEDSYNLGWKEAKAKSKKTTEFYGGWK
jgi:hypothetical protein